MKKIGSPTWSFRDQRDLDELQERRKAFFDDNKPAVRAAILSINTSLSSQPDMLEAVVNDWISRADTIRDALAPFDSGVRADAQSTPG